MDNLVALEADEFTVKQAVESALQEAQKQGASSADVAASLDSGLSVTVRNADIETLEHHRNQGLSVTVYQGQRKGSASTSDLSSDAIREAVEAANRIARYTSEDDCAGLADVELMATAFPDLDLYHPWNISAEQAIDIAKDCEAAAFGQDKRITNSEGASVNAFQGVSAYANSHGFLGLKRGTRHSINCSVIAEDQQGMQRDYEYTSSRVPDKLDDPGKVGRSSAERALRRLSGQKLSTRKAPVLFAADLSSGLMRHFIAAISGGALYRKATFLLDALDQPVFPEFVRIHEDPSILQAAGSTNFDNEGVTPQKRDLITGGVLQAYVLGSYSARKLHTQTTGSAGGVRNLFIDPGKDDFTALLKRMDTGLYVTELIGHGVNSVTGDYSRGAVGFWVENGEIKYPVEEITVAGNLKNMFMDLQAVGTDVDRRGNIQTGSWLLGEMMIAGE
jgi:PmbA protein